MFKDVARSNKVSINASAETVWNILTDFEKYSQWNPFTYKVEGKLVIGEPVTLYVQMKENDKRVQKEEVCIIDKPERLSWNMKMGSSIILAAQRDQFIEVIDANSCTYETTDSFQGLLTPVVMGLFKQHIESGFNKLAQKLKERAEAQ
jgi:hypothetical protein